MIQYPKGIKYPKGTIPPDDDDVDDDVFHGNLSDKGAVPDDEEAVPDDEDVFHDAHEDDVNGRSSWASSAEQARSASVVFQNTSTWASAASAAQDE